jgi:flagellar biosynthesis protein FlhA
MQFVNRHRDLLLPLGLIACLLVMLIPVPPALLDVFLTLNITAGILILLTTIYVGSPMEFSIFPSLLLATTLARLVLNVASTRLILTQAGSKSTAAAGDVVQAFGNFVAGDRVEVGFVIFTILVVIQFLVITKGMTRISEVAARFALDGMPGKQMAIDADLNAGSIDEKEAQRRRQDVSRQADFYGAMDGASKYVRGDAIAGIVITLINITVGLGIGVMRFGMSFTESVEVFTKLTIGDGLVSQVPALLISVAAGLLVTRSAQKSNLSLDFITQLLSSSRALAVAGAFLLVMITTNLPAVPMAAVGLSCIGLAVMTNRNQVRQSIQLAQATAAEESAKNAPAAPTPEDYLNVEAMELYLGMGLLSIADPQRGGDIMERISAIRNQLASDIGIVLPKVRVRDDRSLNDHEYQVRINGNPVARGFVRPDKLLAIDTGQTTGRIEGEATRDPAFNQPAVWIDPSRQQQAVIYGYRPIPASHVVAKHLQEIAKRNADELLGREATKALIDRLKKSNPTIVDELIPGQLKLAEVQQVLQQLLREDVPIRQLGAILETLGDFAGRTKDPIWLAEYARHRLARTICARYADDQRRLFCVTVDPPFEERVANGIEHGERGMFIRMSAQAVELTVRRINDAIQKLVAIGRPPVILVNPRIRPGLRMLIANELPRVRVLSYNEVTQDTTMESVAVVTDSGSLKPVPN